MWLKINSAQKNFEKKSKIRAKNKINSNKNISFSIFNLKFKVREQRIEESNSAVLKFKTEIYCEWLKMSRAIFHIQLALKQGGPAC